MVFRLVSTGMQGGAVPLPKLPYPCPFNLLPGEEVCQLGSHGGFLASRQEAAACNPCQSLGGGGRKRSSEWDRAQQLPTHQSISAGWQAGSCHAWSQPKLGSLGGGRRAAEIACSPSLHCARLGLHRQSSHFWGGGRCDITFSVLSTPKILATGLMVFEGSQQSC